MSYKLITNIWIFFIYLCLFKFACWYWTVCKRSTVIRCLIVIFIINVQIKVYHNATWCCGLVTTLFDCIYWLWFNYSETSFSHPPPPLSHHTCLSPCIHLEQISCRAFYLGKRPSSSLVLATKVNDCYCVMLARLWPDNHAIKMAFNDVHLGPYSKI